MLTDQISVEMDFELIDFDRVEEKNISFQNFTDDDILKNKAKILGDRYGFVGTDKKIRKEEELKEYDCIILGVDNSKIRKLVYDHCFKNNKFFLDMRATGKRVMVITSDYGKKALEYLPKKIGEEDGSCQNAFELDKGIIQWGNRIIAPIGIQMFLNAYRGEKYTPFFSRNF